MARLLWGIFGFSSLFFNFLQVKGLNVEAEVIYEQDQGLRFSMKWPPATPAITLFKCQGPHVSPRVDFKIKIHFFEWIQLESSNESCMLVS